MKLYYDLHLHSCLSPCGHEDMTPANLAAMCALAGLQVVALTDHNTVGNCAAFASAAASHGLLAIPGMELTTAEEVHVLCWFETPEAADAFGALVYERLPALENNPALFGPQLLMDAADTVLGREPRLLAAATQIGIYELAPLVARFGGVACPAHIDRPSFSLLSNLGLWDPALGFLWAECSTRCPNDFLAHRPDVTGVSFLVNSDAHRLDQVAGAAHAMEVSSATPGAVLDWLRRGGPPVPAMKR